MNKQSIKSSLVKNWRQLKICLVSILRNITGRLLWIPLLHKIFLTVKKLVKFRARIETGYRVVAYIYKVVAQYSIINHFMIFLNRKIQNKLFMKFVHKYFLQLELNFDEHSALVRLIYHHFHSLHSTFLGFL